MGVSNVNVDAINPGSAGVEYYVISQATRCRDRSTFTGRQQVSGIFGPTAVIKDANLAGPEIRIPPA